MLDIQKIQEFLPQRFPFLLIDRVIECRFQEKIVTLKNVTMNEPFFVGHFPDTAVMPGVLVVEAMAQSAILLIAEEDNSNASSRTSYYLTAVKARFLNTVFPGDQLKIVVEPIKLTSDAALVKADAFVGDKEIAKAEITLNIKR